MELRPGKKLHSAVCGAQVVVVRAPSAPVELGCGGAPLVEEAPAADRGAGPDRSLGEGARLGKRYVDEARGLELLCVRGGEGALTVDGHLLALKGARPLPSSD